MRLRYMVEYGIRNREIHPHYEPIGVWVQGPGPGMDLVIEYLPGNGEAQERADWIINRLVDDKVRSLPPDFLDYHQMTVSPYTGMLGQVTDTDDFASAEECAAGVLKGHPKIGLGSSD